jgi:hypothetical protein
MRWAHQWLVIVVRGNTQTPRIEINWGRGWGPGGVTEEEWLGYRIHEIPQGPASALTEGRGAAEQQHEHQFHCFTLLWSQRGGQTWFVRYHPVKGAEGLRDNRAEGERASGHRHFKKDSWRSCHRLGSF